MGKKLEFPKGFLFGASTSSHQIEGGFEQDGKTWNMWDHMMNKVYPEKDNGNDACKSYPDLYLEDVDLLKEAGFQVYRLSFSWNRLLKLNGEYKKGSLNPAGVDYYNKLINKLKENGIEPVVTVYHWDLPYYIQHNFGGWTNPLIVDFLEDFAYTLFKEFGDRVKYWITINEPTLILHGYENGKALGLAPGRDLHSPGNYIVVHNMMRAHARIYHLYDKLFRPTQKGKVGISLVGSCYRPKNKNSEEDKKATYEAFQFYLGTFAHPIFTKEGDYPKIVREIVDKNSEKEGRRRSRLPTFTNEEKESLKGSADFFGLNHYMTELCSRKCHTTNQAKQCRPRVVKYHCKDSNPLESFGEDLMVVCEPVSDDDPDPSGFQDILKYIKDNYNDPLIMVTENGIGYQASGKESLDELLHDDYRVNYYNKFLGALLKAIHEDKCNVICYSTWSLLDNFEWSRGYTWKYGIVHVDFKDDKRPRTKKDSYNSFKKIIKDGFLVVD